jgi:(S)-ureidoglycine aminohydrolase
MRSPNQLVYSRARIRDRFALFPLEGYPTSRLPNWDKTEARVLTAPAMGANFVQYLLTVQAGGGSHHKADGRVETFIYMLAGEAHLSITDGPSKKLTSGGFALIPPTASFDLKMPQPGELLTLRKAYEPAPGIEMFKPVFGNESEILAPAWMDNPHSRLQTLIPDDLLYDMAVNIFAFDPGHGLPYVETHVMEHGLYVLEGKGMYYLEDSWMEVDKNDFIWMGPYCPQSYYATGPTPTRYIYYKNVNREIPL